ncbi:hypothetical protein BGZ65_006809 [Modicella reniformis]|uniref:C2H2-type domain-containing protein n=1 Tax=Modicella reniformis TaxID=1440133 RepID=A0A9P6SQ79_9FUNG|nr:hypothetical protein BGZ65_006809 [Modicella reniformis]
MPAVPVKCSMDRTHHDQSSHEGYSSCSANSSKQTSPAPSNRSGSNRGSPVPKASKGKLFQCTGFGDCRMVFTRSEHLARHARKHTGEKPFQCVVEGCTRMFSRFDNMVQHTQTHIKGARRESAAGIASKIAIESRRKSEAGLLGTSGGIRGGNKAPKAKRGSISSTSGSEALPPGRKTRVNSLPGLTVAITASGSSRGRDLIKEALPPTARTPSSRALTPYESKIEREDKNQIPSASARRSSIGSSTGPSSTLSWYASKLHHKSGFDITPYGRHESLDAHLPPLNLRQYEFAMDQSNCYRPRHPLSPARSSFSEDEEDSDELDYSSRQRSRRDNRQRLSWSGMVDSMNLCTLPPLRSFDKTGSQSTRLPSITLSGYRSRSISYECHPNSERYASKTRRLSLADLETPIYQTKKVVDHSTQTQQAPFEGVDVSEDEIYALEAFSELWSQGRDLEMDDHQCSSMSKGAVIKSEFEQLAPPLPGLDTGRRSPRGEDREFSRLQDSKLIVDIAMELD